MKRTLQAALLRAYRLVCYSGLLSTRWGAATFEAAYDLYKTLVEARDVRGLEGLLAPGSWAIDVGANAGFFTEYFARWVSGGGKVLAVEPEAANFERLKRRLDRRALAARVDSIQGAAAEKPGTLRLAINPFHPADHRLSADGIPVQSITLDREMAARGWPKVSLVKIDVQGAEMRVLGGAAELLNRFHPAVYMEVDDEALRQMGTNAEAVLERMLSLGYRIHRLEKGRRWTAIEVREALVLCRGGRYHDFLFLKEKFEFPNVAKLSEL